MKFELLLVIRLVLLLWDGWMCDLIYIGDLVMDELVEDKSGSCIDHQLFPTP